MPKTTYSRSTYALVAALSTKGNFSERQIAAMLCLKRSAVHHLLNHQPKNRAPDDVDPAVIEAATLALAEARNAGMRALAQSLRDAADRIDAAA